MVEAPLQSENEEQKLAREAVEKERGEMVKKIGYAILSNLNNAIASDDSALEEKAEQIQKELVSFTERLKQAVPDYERYKLFHLLSSSTPKAQTNLFDVEGDRIFNFANELVERFKLNVE